MATNENNITRRQTLAGFGLAAAAVAVPTSAVAKLALGSDRSAWDAAFARYQRANAKHIALVDAHSQAEEAHSVAHPRKDIFFDEYRLGIGMTYERAVETLNFYSIIKKRPINAKAIAEEFMAYQHEDKELSRRFKLDELDDAVTEHLKSEYLPARDALMQLAAPDAAGLLAKIEIATVSLENDHAESMLADARRLLSHGRA